MLQEEHAIAADAAQRFQFEKQIEQAREELADLERETAGPAPAITGSLPLAVDANPAAATLFVGREAELAQLTAALLGPAVRPVAVVGMAGSASRTSPTASRSSTRTHSRAASTGSSSTPRLRPPPPLPCSASWPTSSRCRPSRWPTSPGVAAAV